jgi:ribosomal protein S18 acetylase RimI-like enzyme
MITVERATLADREILIDLTHRQFIEHEIMYTAEILDSAIEEMLAKEGLGILLIAIENSQVIGFAVISFSWTLEHGGKSAWLDELYVLPEYRGRGVGSMLVGKVIEAAKKEGCKAIDLEVEEDHRRAERLYERKGFERLTRSRWAKSLS